jgi:hypothetical protein
MSVSRKLSVVGLPFNRQRTPGSVGKRESSRGLGSLAPAERAAEAHQHELRRLIAPVGLASVEKLLDDDRFGLIDDHPPGGVTIGLQGRQQFNLPCQLARKAAESAGSQADVPIVEVKGSADSIFVIGGGAIGQRREVGRQILDIGLCRARGGAGPADQGMISWGGLRFWPADTRSGLGSGYSVAAVGIRCGVGFCAFWASVAWLSGAPLQ